MIKSRKLRWAGHVARMEEGRSDFKMLTRKPTGKRPLRRSRLDENIKTDLKWIDLSIRNLTDCSQDTDFWEFLVNATLILWVL